MGNALKIIKIINHGNKKVKITHLCLVLRFKFVPPWTAQSLPK